MDRPVLRLDPESAECLVYTYKEGLLSALAHDLRIRVTRFTIDLEPVERTIEARFEADSLQVDCAVKDGRDLPQALSEKDRHQIEATMMRDVLEVTAFPEIRFVSTLVQKEGGGGRVEGTVHLHGRQKPVQFTVRAAGTRLIAQVRLHQPDFGIRPYTAMLGTLKLRPHLDVRVSMPSDLARELGKPPAA